MGNVGEYFFDCPESVAPDHHERSGEQARVAQFMADQVREFVLGYWLRAMAQTLPQPYPDLGRLEPPPFLRGLNLAPPANPELSGMGNLQRLFKKKNGETGQFSADQAKAIIALRPMDPIPPR